MSSNPQRERNTLFPPGSVGRSSTQGSLSRTSSHESLTAHPLLSPTLAVATSPASSDPAAAPRYVPYTPRQRVATTSTTTTGTTALSSPPPHSFQGDATSKLQLMNLKAAAQKGGLDAASTGWAILEKLGTEGDHGPEWNRIWAALAVGKATLLLPLEAQPANEPVTAEFIKDHIAYWDSSRDAPVVTLSGLRGTMADEVLTIRSTLDPASKAFRAVQDPHTRTSALGALPPLPVQATLPSSSTSSSSPSPSVTPLPLPLPTSPRPPSSDTPYPAFNLTSHHPSLPLLPRPYGPAGSKPPLPPRPRPGGPAHPSPAQSRLSNTFASLFGRAATPTPPQSPLTGTSPLQPPPDASPPPDGGPDHVLGVPAFTLSRRIVRRDVARAVLRSVRADVRAGLAPSAAPSWVAERVEEFAEREGLFPFTKAPQGVGGYLVAQDAELGMDEVGHQFQDFYHEVGEQLVKRKWKGRRAFGGLGFQHRHHTNGSISSWSESAEAEEEADETEKESETEERQHEDDVGKRIREVVEAVERTLCCVFYDRLFMQSFSDDATHDEALSSRIAAVNILDLTLAHLGVDVGASASPVESVVRACGETLTQLEVACRAPADKAAVLVASHKILVDGLSRLPPVKLHPEDDILDDKTPRAPTFGALSADDDDDDDDDGPLDTSNSTGLLHDSPTVVLAPNSTRAQDVAAPETLPVARESPPSTSPRLTISPAPMAAPTPVSGDVILPLMIFAAVKANPPHLVSHLLYTQRFRNQSVGGEESYCLINVMAVAEFLENVDLAALGLGESQKNVISTAELTPITITRPGSEPTSPRIPVQASLRGRVEQQVDAIAGSANKVISGVVDSSFGVLRALLPGVQSADTPATGEPDQQDAARPGFGILRRDTGFSIASLAASLPGAGAIRAKTPVPKDEDGQQLVEVPSRPASIRSARRPASSDEEDSEEDEEEEEEGQEEEEGEDEEGHDTRSIRSFESMMSRSSRRKKRRVPKGRKSLTDRLASMPGLSRLGHHEPGRSSPPLSRQGSLLAPPHHHHTESPVSSTAPSPIAIRISPPHARFLECTEDDLRVSEVGELLREYRRMVEAVRAMGGFHE